jgi:hypothetical protein
MRWDDSMAADCLSSVQASGNPRLVFSVSSSSSCLPLLLLFLVQKEETVLDEHFSTVT